MKNSDTRSLAWEKYRTDKKRKTAKGKVVNSIARGLNEPKNYIELERSTGLRTNSITRAICDLLNDGVIEYTVKVNRFTGNNCRHYKLIDWPEGIKEELSFDFPEIGAII